MERPSLYRRFNKLLIANRGEIAVRVIRTAKAMGLRTVAVYSEADRTAMHVGLADEAVLLGPARARDSYLDIARVIDAARRTGAEAVHPGYGFLSESAEFAQACLDAGLIFVGPTAAMITAMGSKSGSKFLMEQAGVPLVPGYHGNAQDEATLAKEADKIGFPVLVKASAGGGGRGMRIVRSAPELAAGITSAKREAKAAFGDDHVLIEKYVENPRHIEVQIIGDSHGNLLSLFERECTLQRRHQKVIEEAPSPTLNASQREAVCAAARKAAAAVNYVGAGTIEFVSDGKDVFFIEMNTRLQVEHPVTELITGIDLVEWQLRVAFGERLPLTQDQIELKGHAIEARVYAENPGRNFMPSVGLIRTWRMPDAVDGLRIDAGYGEGCAVSPYYDAMLAKMIAWAPDRETAIGRLNRGLEDSDVRGIVTNIPFLSRLVTHPLVRANAIDTGFIERELAALTAATAATGELELCAAVAAILAEEQRAAASEPPSPWRVSGWMPVGRRQRVFAFRSGQGAEQTIVLRYGNGPATLTIGGRELVFALAPREDGALDLTLDGVTSRTAYVIEGHELYLRTRNGRFELHWVDPFGGETEEQVGEDKIVAPLPGTVVALLAKEGDRLEKGAAILTLEVMKMEQTLRAPFAGVVKSIKCKVGDIVGEGVELAEVEPAEESGIMSDTVRIVEMGPRDGLQNEKTPVGVAARIAFIEALVACGLHTVEVGAFVSPKAIPQMIGSDEVLRGVNHIAGAEFHVLVPNLKGYEAAHAAGARVVSVFAAASEGFSRANINCTIAESIERFRPVIARARADGIKVRGYVSCVLGCPYEGEVKPQAVVDVARVLWDLGCYEISLGDTIGVGTPGKARELLRAVAGSVPMVHLAMHFHDTYGQALANLYAGMEEGARVIDAAAGGLGGCPFAPGATGNVATEDVVYMLEGLGIATGVDMTKLVAATNAIAGLLGRPPASRVVSALNAKARRL